MSSNVIELDNTDEMLIYQQNLNQKQLHVQSQSKSQNSSASSMDSKKQSISKSYNARRKNNKGTKGLISLPSKFVLRPLLLKYIDKIQQLFLEEKTPNQIHIMLKEPTLVEIQCILKQKIHTFLNIIFESSHCFTEDQVQKIRPQVNEKIQRISLQMLQPFKNNFLDLVRYQNFLKLMKYHKEGRRSQKISKKCNTFFRLFFLKMKFQGISHTQDNIIELNEPLKKNRKAFLDSNDSDQESDTQQSKKKRNNKTSRNDDLYGSKTSTKKNIYGRQAVVNQKMMDDAKQSLLKQIRSKTIQNQSQKHKQISNSQKMNQSSSEKKPQILGNKSEVQIIQDDATFQWVFDKENTLLFLLFEALFKKSKLTKTIRKVNETFSKKYDKTSKQQLDFDKITSKIQSMFSISCQKFIRRIKFLTIKQGLQHNPNSNTNENRKQNSLKSSKKKKVYSIMDIQKSIEIQNDQKNLSKEDEFYFSKLKEHLKALQVQQVYLSSAEGSSCQQEWKFMLEFIREFYFSTLQDFRFDHLLEYAKRVIQFNAIEKKLDQRQIDIGEQAARSQEEKQKKPVDREIDLLDKLPKSSFCFTLSKIGKSKFEVANSNISVQNNQQSQHHQSENLQFVSIDEILRKSNIHIESKKSVDLKNLSLKRSYSKHFIDDQVKQENQEQNDKKIRQLGEPMKKVKQNEKPVYIAERKQIKDEFESDDQFEEIVELSSSIEEKIINQQGQNNQNVRPVFSQQSDPEQQPVQEVRKKQTISVKSRGTKHITVTEDQGQINNKEMEDLMREIQQDHSQDDQNKVSHADLSIIQEQDSEDASQNISNKGEAQICKNLLALEDEYSIYEIDFSTQQHTQAEIQNPKQKIYQKNIQIPVKTKEKINQITDSCQNLEIIRKELQKIKATNDQQPILQPKSYPDKILNSYHDRSKLHTKTSQIYK